MVIFPYPKPTKCYGDTVIRRAEKVDSITEKVDFLHNFARSECKI